MRSLEQSATSEQSATLEHSADLKEQSADLGAERKPWKLVEGFGHVTKGLRGLLYTFTRVCKAYESTDDIFSTEKSKCHVITKDFKKKTKLWRGKYIVATV